MILPSIPQSGMVDWQVFGPINQPLAAGVVSVANLSFTEWRKPHGCNWIFIFAVGGGGGGGGGQSGASGTARTGGGGGGSAGYVRFLVPSAALPDSLYLCPGAGGMGGGAGVQGGGGTNSYVCLYPRFDNNVFVAVDGRAGFGGNYNGAFGQGLGGNGGANAANAFAQYGWHLGSSGQNGGAGGTTGAATVSMSGPFSGGGGGGGADATNANQNGGQIAGAVPATGPVIRPAMLSSSSLVTAPSGYNHGQPILQMIGRAAPMAFSGGVGGRSVGLGTGGDGGAGAWGSGGGGGGAGITGGNGGRGGDGFVLIGAW